MTVRRGPRGIDPLERVRYKGDFDRAYKTGRRLVCRWFVAFIVVRPTGRFRFGVVASRKVGGAVARNRAKRMLREVYRRNKPGSQFSGDIVLIARHSILGAGYVDIETAYGKSVGRFLETHA